MLQDNNYIKDIDWEEIKQYKILCKDKFLCCAEKESTMILAKENGIDFYAGLFVQSYEDVLALKKLGSRYILVASPLFFDMDALKNLEVDIRLTPNISNVSNLFHENSAHGQWIRPEDLRLYEPYASSLEFLSVSPKQERALFRIYKIQKKWSGDLDLLLDGFTAKARNLMISSEITKARLNCQQKCERNGTCHICDRMIGLADPELIRNYQEAISKT